MERYELSKTLAGHQNDVRAVAHVEGRIFTASRDGNIIVWDSNTGKPLKTLSGHKSFVNSLCVWHSADGKHRLVSGGSDNVALIWNLEDERERVEPISTLEGHTGNISSISTTRDGLIITGSWDKTARVWEGEKCVWILEGHEAAVWAVLELPNGEIVTGSADRKIKMWRDGREVRSIDGTLCIRSLILLNNEKFASTGNDGKVTVFDFSGNVQYQFKAHDEYIFTMAVDNDGIIATGGEDRIVKLWRENEANPIQCIPHSPTVWSINFLPDGDLVVATSDCTARIWSKNPSRRSSNDEEVAFTRSLEQQELSAENIGVELDALPDVESLQTKGENEGDTTVVKEPQGGGVFMWINNDWKKIGIVVKSKSTKVEHEGLEYDFVFDVEVGEEGERKLKLAYNNDVDPYQASTSFVEKYQLSKKYLDPIASFIISNANPHHVGARPASFDDQ